MSREEALAALKKLDREHETDFENSHAQADDILLLLIDDPEITDAYNAVGKWYA